ncbi:peptidoglycan-binding protein [Streptomyces sp. SID12488]|uniref:peptidoglycan-binding protein n=1 Tax=Streptomyces sp. SID12488 TaxID=2706040 RepID=UPI0013DCE85A|nr:peptidoglycan-binding protein [Streptomyces sp. SID12488]NEA63921.1 N-acetylmuramoyl-L-alanine amidase [Streptomyces sp. SID12488]
MAKFSGATWRPIPINYTEGGQSSVRGLVVHIMAGTLAGTDSWFRNPKARASSHFGTGKAGALYQWVDTADRAWAQAGGNTSWLSIEDEGQGGDELTSAQMDRIAEVFAWVHKTYGVPLQVASGPNGKGLGYHAMGGSAWGSHPSCPGSRIIAQLPEIVTRAKRIAAPAAPTFAPFPGAAFFRNAPRSALITAMGKRLVAEGCGKYATGPGPQWTEADRKSYAAWQRERGFTGSAADGWPGKTTWDALRVPRV